ncbi:unnamed protein product [Clonostachys chloroleuca]|uniref:sn-1-specific diacylglycerol lipase n=1 Tax=Clonostachys chloroleuca TaxID=1926264 RepID=A0AA35LYT1_9HYPO|nr:unnamed protein product [Clonostachys chloroleuca]
MNRQTAVSPATGAPHQLGPTLLPAPIASAVSFATRSTCFAIRVGSFVGTYGLDAARFTTLSSLEVARGLLEGVLARAGRDVMLIGPQSEFAAADAETVLERGLENLHHAVSQIVFWTSASFQLTSTTLSTASDLSQLLLSSLDQLFGATEPSRAIASIITLIRREFNNPVTGSSGEKVGVVDLILSLSALAYLQGQCWKSKEDERRRQALEEVVWDIVVLDDGERIDVQHSGQSGIHPDRSVVPNGDARRRSRILGDLSGPLSPPSGKMDDDEEMLEQLKLQIASSLPPGSTVSVSNSVSTVQTITVDVEGPEPVMLPTPPGAEIVEATSFRPSSRLSWASQDQESEPSFRVVYQIKREKLQDSKFHTHEDGLPIPQVEDLDDEGVRVKLDGREEGKELPSIKYSSPLQFPSHPRRQSQSSQSVEGDCQPGGEVGSPPPARVNVEGPPRRMSTSRANPTLSEKSPNQPTPPKKIVENAANQKRPRAPPEATSTRSSTVKPKQESPSAGRRPQITKRTSSSQESRSSDKKGSLRDVIKGSGQSISNIWNRESSGSETGGSSSKLKPQWRIPSGSGKLNAKLKPAASIRPTKPDDRRPSSRSQLYPDPETIPRSSSRANCVSIQEHRRNSIISQADAFSIRANGEMRAASPTFFRTEVSTHDTVSRPTSSYLNHGQASQTSPKRGHHEKNRHSLYSLGTNDSQMSVVLSSYYQKSAYRTSNALSSLRQAGFVEGTFPVAPLLQNISRYMRFASASYGSQFLKLLGISNDLPAISTGDETHHDVRHFLHHTESDMGSILLASFVDNGGGSDSSGFTDTGVPLVHYISLDHNAKAVVLACRGTLGFEDVLADLTCEYDRLEWRGRGYKVHKGIHASARRILYGGDGRVLVTLQEALREFPDYGLVLCGHSLGGSVTSLLGIMMAEPNPDGPGFVTTSETQSSAQSGGWPERSTNLQGASLPPGRPIHVFAYGPPGAMSVALSKNSRGLITTVVHGNDIVPYLSLGTLHDFQALALSFKKDENSAKAEIRQRMWAAFQYNVAGKLYGSTAPPLAVGEEPWMLPTLESMRANMDCEKLIPPGEVFCIESQRVLRRDAFLVSDEERIGRPAQRVVLKYIKDVPARFREMRFGTSMLMDHSPAKYEEALQKLRLGVAL